MFSFLREPMISYLATARHNQGARFQKSAVLFSVFEGLPGAILDTLLGLLPEMRERNAALRQRTRRFM